MKWSVCFTAKARKQASLLPEKIRSNLFFVVRELEERGPFRVEKTNFGKIKGLTETYHCHLNKGKPRYVVVWQVKDKKVRLLEVRYVGTHEKAPY